MSRAEYVRARLLVASATAESFTCLVQQTTAIKPQRCPDDFRQHAMHELKRLLQHHKSILVPRKCEVLGGKIDRCIASEHKFSKKLVNQTTTITSRLYNDGSSAANAGEFLRATQPPLFCALPVPVQGSFARCHRGRRFAAL